MNEQERLDKVRGICAGILRGYSTIPQNKMTPAGRDIIAYARAAQNLCDAIELGHRDSSKGSAFNELNSLLSSMVDIQQRMQRKGTVKVSEDNLLDSIGNEYGEETTENEIGELSESEATDIEVDDFLRAQIFNEIQNERERQIKLKNEGKFAHTCADLDIEDMERLPILAEEFGEVSKEVMEQIMNVRWTQKWGDEEKNVNRARLRKELIEVAACAVAWVEAIDLSESTETDNE